MTLPTVDTQIHLSDLLLFGGALVAFVKMFVSNRDILRDLVKAMGTLTKDVDRIEDRQQQHHEWLIRDGLDLREGVDRRTAVERRQYRHENGN